MKEIHRVFTPGVAALIIAVIITLQLVALAGFARTYMERGRRIEALEESLCRERLARIAAMLLGPSDCRGAERVLASSTPPMWTRFERLDGIAPVIAHSSLRPRTSR